MIDEIIDVLYPIGDEPERLAAVLIPSLMKIFHREKYTKINCMAVMPLMEQLQHSVKSGISKLVASLQKLQANTRLLLQLPL